MSARRLEVRLLGPVAVIRDGEPLHLPPSRKVLVLLAYLALSPAPVTRTRLCDLLWDVPNDPRGELRWSLSKLRALVPVVTTGKELVALDLRDVFVDALEVDNAANLELFRGDFLEGLEPDGGPELSTWLASQRQHFRGARIAGARAAGRFDEWLALAPFDIEAHEALLASLLAQGRARDGDEHLARAARAFEQEGLDWAPLRAWWKTERARTAAVVAVEPAPRPRDIAGPRRASIAVMPFVGEMGHGLTDDIITRLAKLRALFVIARGSAYALGERGLDPAEAGRLLGVDYVASGRVRVDDRRISVLVELAETRTAQIVWTDELAAAASETFEVLDAIGNRIVAAIAEEIEAAECRRAMLKAPASLDAWEAYHRGLWHMYRFTEDGNREAAHFFRRALDLDPTFARAHSGISFTHFQNVFLDLTPDRDAQIDQTFTAAAASLAADERDPTAHWAMGRALWLRGETTESVSVLERSIELSPNFALGHYMLGFVEAQSGDPAGAIASANTSSALSPFDPLQFGMMGSRALGHMRRGEHEEAAVWAQRAAARPNAHAHILAIAALAVGLTGRRDEARKLVGRIRERLPAYDSERFFRAFRFGRDAEKLLRRTAKSFDF